MREILLVINLKDGTICKQICTFSLFSGRFGAHKFYFGQIGIGVLYAVFCWTFIPSLICLIETFLSGDAVKSKNLQIAQEIFEEIKLLRDSFFDENSRAI